MGQVLQKKINLPDNVEEMIEEYEARLKSLNELPDVVATIKYQSDYIGSLNKDSGFYSNLDTDLLNKNFVDFVVNKIGDIRTFRDKTHVSWLTGEQSPTLKGLPWAERVDDSKKAYLA